MSPAAYFSYVTNAITELLTREAGLFAIFGFNLFKAFAIILIAWFGIKSALSSAGGGPGFQLDRFAGLLLTIAFTFTMINYYNHPIPGIGRSFHNLITDQGMDFAAHVEERSIGNVLNRIHEVYERVPPPSGASLLNPIKVGYYFLVLVLLVFAQLAVFGVVSYGLVATAVCALIGPIFIPFLLVPTLEWMFWGWLKCFLQYAFYPVVANAFVFIFGQFLINFLDAHVSELGIGVATLILPFCLVLVSFIWGLLKVPALVSSIFTGRSGDSAIPFLKTLGG